MTWVKRAERTSLVLPTCNAPALKANFCALVALIPITDMTDNTFRDASQKQFGHRTSGNLHTLYFSSRLQLIRAPAVK